MAYGLATRPQPVRGASPRPLRVLPEPVYDSAILAALQPGHARELVAASPLRRYRRGEVVFRAGDPGGGVHVIRRGAFLEEVVRASGQSFAVEVLGRGEAFGDAAAIDPAARRGTTVTALADAETLLIDAETLARLRQYNAAVADALLRALAARVERLTERLLDAMFVPAERRVRDRLQELARVAEPADEHGAIIVPVTQDWLGRLAGASRATVNRVLREDERAGVLRLRRGRIEILAAAK